MRKQQEPEIVRSTKIIVPYNNHRIAYLSPAVGPDSHRNVGQKILWQGLLVPHGDYTAPLIYAVYCSKLKNKPEFTYVLGKLKNNWLCVFNQDYWTDKGLYVMQDNKALGTSKPLPIKTLERMLRTGKELNWGGVRVSADGSVRFAPKGSYRFEELTPEELAKDGSMIAQYGLRGAELSGEASATLPNKPRTYGIEVAEGKNPELRVSALFEFVSRLHFYGVEFEGDGNSYAFPVSAPNAKIFK
ncbi:MAG TPA: hypothetical protein VJK03_04895 [Candidatus Nanoarchaeia archaeon]|nr:hypothetical protein [Candidatus Nanoarchaeia archaeon]